MKTFMIAKISSNWEGSVKIAEKKLSENIKRQAQMQLNSKSRDQ